MGIDENTGVVIEPATGVYEYLGQGSAIVLTSEGEQIFDSGARFPATALRDERSPHWAGRHTTRWTGRVWRGRNETACADDDLNAEGDLDTTEGHVLAVYDAGNPDYRNSGKAQSHRQAAVGDCLYQALLCRLSRQRFLASSASASELSCLVCGI